MKRRFRPLIYILAAAQLLLAVPMTSAASTTTTSHSASMPCADSMPTAHSGDCPCCPDGAPDMATCLSACTLAHASISTIHVISAPAPSIAVPAPAFVPVVDVNDPPLKPPPII